MKSIVFFLISIFFVGNICANDTDQSLEVEKEGLVVSVVNFEEGDKIKLFDVESGDHILSKTHGDIDLSQLPIGMYLLENTHGKSVMIERFEEEIQIEGVLETANNDFVLERDSVRADMPSKVNEEEEFINYYENTQRDLLAIEREGDVITVVDFEEGDVIKLFEVKNTVHILSKTINIVDLSQLPAGIYFLENNKGESVVLEKFLDNDQVADME
ncbi:hypothetical protein ABW636_15910 [Aquimarina sp. 2201CG1-2-11]|uniref:hypothetical protein n=1 Tax=Aquimarina discodermiae TaxID=3231043 RepID=UPI0034618B9E